ncbi:hypothetical protein ACFWHN_26900, partial [Streptomyces yangpuensis]
FAHLDATTVLSRPISEKGIYPAVEPLDTASRHPDPPDTAAAPHAAPQPARAPHTGIRVSR